MNDEAGPSGTQNSTANVEELERERLLNAEEEDEQEQEQPVTGADRAKWRKLALRTRIHHLQHLLDEFDMVIFTQLAIIYYMDCSFLRFIFRCAIQASYLMARPNMPEVVHSPVLNITASNIICMLWHALSRHPEAGEAARGYLHGGAMMDFIGQQGPISKLHLLLLDLVVLGLQLIMFTINIKERQLKKRLFPTPPTVVGTWASDETTSSDLPAPEMGQDLDAEERGVVREDSPDREARDEQLESLNSILAGRGEHSTEASLELLRSGQVAIADLYVVSTLREQLWTSRRARSTSGTGTGTSSGGLAGIRMSPRTRRLAASMLGRRVGLQASLRATDPGGG